MPPKTTKQQLKAAKSLIDGGSHEEAAAICENLIASDASNYHAHVLLGVSRSARGDVAGAIASYTAATVLRPDTPLAHKGILDVLREPDDDPVHRLALARAHLALADSPSGDVSTAAQLLHELAKQDGSLVDEALAALRRLRDAKHDTDGTPWAKRIAWKEADILAGILSQDRGSRGRALEEGPIALALDELQQALLVSSIPVSQDHIFDLVVSRVISRCSDAQNVEEGVKILTQVGAHEALLSLAETDVVPCVPAQGVVEAGFRGLHTAPYNVPRRARAVVAGELLKRKTRAEFAERLVRLHAVKRRGGAGALSKGKVEEIGSTTEAAIKVLMHLEGEENKLAYEVARAGQRLAEELGGRSRMHALLGLQAAAALCGDRKYKDAIKEYTKARLYAQRVGDGWLEAAANRGLVETSVIGYGRKSRQTSTAVEEAAGSAENLYGLLENAWTDALADDVDVERMAELTEAAVQEARTLKGEDLPKLPWECSILNSKFTMSSAELAAVASSRLGQMVMYDSKSEPNTLMQAQKHQMDAANLFKGLPNPFAQLGWIFEKLAVTAESQKMATRAIRCYEKALALDVAHPVASRRLTRMLFSRGLPDEAAEIARQVTDRNPRARWAYNVMGWSRIAKQSFDDSTVYFRNAMRGRLKPSSKTEEALFGTDIARTVQDNDLVVDIDSWRGLSAAYRGQGKVGPAVACINDALTLLAKPPIAYSTAALYNVDAYQQKLRPFLEAEKAVLLQVHRESDAAAPKLQSLLREADVPFTINLYLGESLINMAARDWVAGSYYRSTMLRLEASRIQQHAVREQCTDYPHLNPASTFKRLGDVFMEAVTSHPNMLAGIVPREHLDTGLGAAVNAYSQAMHYEPWRTSGRHDLAAALLRTVTSTGEESTAKEAVALLLRGSSDPAVLVIAFLTLAGISGRRDVAEAACQLGVRVSKRIKSHKNVVALNTCIAVQSSFLESLSGSGNALNAIRHDPTDWRGWVAVASIREGDARRNKWPLEMIQSSEEAYREADRLGGGPIAARGVVRCGTELLKLRKSGDIRSEEVYADACFYASTASRAGRDVPSVCREIICDHLRQVFESAKSKAQDSSGFPKDCDLYNHIHFYPFLPEVAELAATSC